MLVSGMMFILLPLKVVDFVDLLFIIYYAFLRFIYYALINIFLQKY